MSATVLIRVHSLSELDKALRDNAIGTERPVLSCVGGAAGIAEHDLATLAELLRAQLIPAIEELAVTIVDGGTDSGIMRLIGQARAATRSSFQLIGVTASGTVRQPGSPEPHSDDTAEIEPNHTHIVLVPGESWGDETPWLSAVTETIAAGMPSATLVINGGSITFNDARASLDAQRPLIVLAGSGRAADEIADARAGKPAGEKAQEIAASPLTTIVSMRDPDGVLDAIESILARG